MLDFSQVLSADQPLVHPTSQVKNCTFGRYVEVGDHCVLEETHIGDYTYCFGGNDVIYTEIGKFNSIATGVRIAREFGLRCVIVHGTEGHLIPELLLQAGVPVITGPALGDRSKPELANMTLENPAILQRAGVPVAICTDHPEVPIQYLPLCAALAVKGGLEAEAALAAITVNAARIAGLDGILGSLVPGREADIVVTSGHPLELLGQVRAVLIGGRRI